MTRLILLIVLIIPARISAQQPTREFLRSMGPYRFADGGYVMLGLMNDLPVVIFDDGAIRGLRSVGEGYSIGNAIGSFVPVQGSLEIKRSQGTVTVSRDGAVRKAVRMPLTNHDIKFKNGDVSLNGTLILPEGKGPFPLVIMTHGSGPEKKEVNLGLACLFAGKGVAAFVYDKRFVSEQGEDWDDDSFENYALDAIAAAGAVSTHPGIDPGKIGIYGHSQGGWVAPLAVSKSNVLSFLIISAGNAVTPVEQHLWSGRQANRLNGVSERAIEEIYQFRKIKYAAGITGDSTAYLRELPVAQSKPWFVRTGPGLPTGKFWKLNGYYDPEPALKTIQCPVLVIGGSLDTQSNTLDNMVRFRRIFEEGGNRNVTYKTFENANHAYLLTATGKFLENEFKELAQFAPGYFDTLTNWTMSVCQSAK